MITRKYPHQPLLGVGAVILKNDKILLVKRKFEPKARFWTLPGGMVELGESLDQALKREIREECGIKIEPQKIIDVIDYIERDEDDQVKYHYLLVDFQAEQIGGTLSPSSDVLDAGWFDLSELSGLTLPEITQEFLKKHCYID